MTQEHKVMQINHKVAQNVRCSDFKSGARKVRLKLLLYEIIPRNARINIVLHESPLNEQNFKEKLSALPVLTGQFKFPYLA